MSSIFRLYPDCKLVPGASRAAIYDLTRNKIHIVPKEVAMQFEGDCVDFDMLSDEVGAEYRESFLQQELGRFNMPPEINPISEEYIHPSIISNAIIDIGKEDMPLAKIASELSDLLCDTICLRFVENATTEMVLATMRCFMSTSARSIELCLKYVDGIEDRIIEILRKIHLCTRVTVVRAPARKVELIQGSVPVRYTETGFNCGLEISDCDYSKYASANLSLYNESLHFHNCLNRKVVVDRYGYIRNCPEMGETFGNLCDGVSLSEIVKSEPFQKKWRETKDAVPHCCDCELRYACQHCDIVSSRCTYNVYSLRP